MHTMSVVCSVIELVDPGNVSHPGDFARCDQVVRSSN